MPIPASINDLSTTAGSNSPAGSESPSLIDDYLRTYASYIAQLRDAAQSNGFSMATAGGAANAITATYSPAVTTLNDSTVLLFKAAAANTGAATFSPNGLTAKPIVGAGHGTLQGGEIIANGEVCLQYNSSIGGGSWVLVYSTGAGGTVVNQTLTAFTTAGTAPSFTLTPIPALGSYAAPQRFHVTFNAAAATGGTLNISGLGAKNLKQYDSTGAKVTAVIASGQIADVVYDGTDMVVLDQLPTQKQIQPITASVASNALTLTLNPTTLDFRSSTLSSGTVSTRSVASAISLVVPSGATLGTASATFSRVVLLAIDNAGAVELAVVNLAGGNNLDETTLITTTAISASSNASGVIYSTTARTGVPFRIVGFVDSTQTTAGTWAAAPSTIQGAGGQALAAMSSVGHGQAWQNVVGSRAAGTTYTNTTGKPIVVSVSGHSTSTSNVMTLSVNGVTVAEDWYYLAAGSSNGGGNVSAIVPHGATYVANVTTYTISFWAELR